MVICRKTSDPQRPSRPTPLASGASERPGGPVFVPRRDPTAWVQTLLESAAHDAAEVTATAPHTS